MTGRAMTIGPSPDGADAERARLLVALGHLNATVLRLGGTPLFDRASVEAFGVDELAEACALTIRDLLRVARALVE